MRTLWLNWVSASPDAADRLGEIDYPLCFNLPSRSWKLGTDSIALIPETVAPKLNVDLLFELDRALAPTGANPDVSFVRGLRLCVGVSEGAFANSAATQIILTERDKGVFRYYERWPEKYNLVSDLLPCRDAAALPPIRVSAGRQMYTLLARPRLGPIEILKFFHSFNALAPGDLVSLGSLASGLEIPFQPYPVELQLGDDWNFRVSISRDSGA